MAQNKDDQSKIADNNNFIKSAIFLILFETLSINCLFLQAFL
jgi:hypothetical protein